MGLKRVRAKNFKSYRDLDVTLGPLNILIGANASGKSNFVEIFRFLHDIDIYGLDDAIALRGGAQYLLSAQAEGTGRLSISISADVRNLSTFRKKGIEDSISPILGVHTYEILYDFTLEFSGEERPRIVDDRLTLNCNFVRLERNEDGEVKSTDNLGTGTVTLILTQEGEPKCILEVPDNVALEESDILPQAAIESEDASIPALLLEKRFFYFPFFYSPSQAITDDAVAIYNLNNLLAKRPSQVAGRTRLHEDASNLALVLSKVFDSDESKTRFLRLLGDLLPFVKDIEVRTFDRSLFLRLEETSAPKVMFPATLISDGTIDVAALVFALYFQEYPTIVIEEPERNLHPNLIAKLVAMLEDVSDERQIIVTTHSPELVRHANQEHILLVSREEKGHSTVSRPTEKKHVQAFLQNDLGIDDLYVDNLLEG